MDKEIFERLKAETIQDLHSRFQTGDSMDKLIKQIVTLSAETTKVMLMKYHEEVTKKE